MLSSSPSKIHEPRVTGVSPRPTDQRSARKLRNTRGRVPLYAFVRLELDGTVTVVEPVRAGVEIVAWERA